MITQLLEWCANNAIWNQNKIHAEIKQTKYSNNCSIATKSKSKWKAAETNVLSASRTATFRTTPGLDQTFKMWKTIFSPEMVRKAVP